MTPPETTLPDRPRWRAVAALWLGWYLALILFQPIVWARFTLDRPDYAYPWTGDMTAGYADGPATGPWFYARWDSPRYGERQRIPVLTLRCGRSTRVISTRIRLA